ncbi:hypothetical protein [Catenuloplanes japonicus]|uniref:hypothetical protein n=1 Tax=Catenuloplanes japonicus TaxID=33876 RepID=UPI0005242901|nr:hypothetical protein [Catenuloplanes japonicus]
MSSRARLALSTAVLAGTLTAVAAPALASPALAADADVSAATTAPVRYALPATGTVTDVLAVGNEVWIASGDTILITSPTGKVRKTITGVSGARGLTLAPGGTSVFASASTGGAITQFSAAGATVGTWTTQPCPGRSAVAAGALWYSYGCDGSHGVARLDLTTHADASVLADADAQSLTAAGSTLVTYTSGGSGWAMTSYTIAGGALTRTASVRTGTTYAAELSPDGGTLLATDYDHGYGVARYDARTLTLTGTNTTGPYPNAVTWSPDGAKYAAVIDAHYTERPVHIFSRVGTSLVTSTTAGSTGYGNPSHEASWSGDGRYVYSLAQSYGEKPYLVVTPAAGQTKGTVTVAVTKPAAYHRNMTVTVRTPGRPRTAVTVAVAFTGGTVRKTLTTDAGGKATWTLAARSSATITATTATDQKYLAGSGTARVSTPSAATVTWTGARVSNGVAHYASASDVHGVIQALPKRAGRITVALQHRAGTKWVTDQTSTWSTDSAGVFDLGLTQGARKTLFRIQVTVAPDASGTASPRVTSGSFIVD